MLYTFLVILLILDSIVLVAAILLQSGKGGGLAASFGGATSAADSLIGTRQAGNLLTKASWWCGGIFLLLAFVLQIASTRNRLPASVLDKPLTNVSDRAGRADAEVEPGSSARGSAEDPGTGHSACNADARSQGYTAQAVTLKGDRPALPPRVPPPRGRNPFSRPAGSRDSARLLPRSCSQRT